MEALRVENICLNIAGARILDGVSLTVQTGERRAIIGPNGAGKTTLFRIVAGELPPSRGGVWLFGQEVTAEPAYLRARRGLVRTFQQTSVFLELTVLENLLLACARGRSRWMAAFRPIHRDRRALWEAEALMEDWGLTRWAHSPVRGLAYGIQRRLELAMAFAARPRVLLLDEPSAGLAAADVEELGQRLLNIPREVTVVFIDHNMKTVFAAADRITVLHHGQVLAEGPPDQIRNDAAIQAAYLGAGRPGRAAAD